MEFHPAVWKSFGLVSRGACALTLAISLSGLALAAQSQQEGQGQGQQQSQQQEQSTQSPQPQQQAQDPQSPTPPSPQQNDRPQPSNDQQAPPAQQPQAQQPQASQQNANRPPISRDVVPQNYQNGPNDPNPNDQYAPPPALLTIPPGTVVVIRTNEGLSSDHNQIGDQFTGVLEQPIIVNGWVVARRGETVIGQVKAAKKAGRVTGTSQLGVELTDITLVDGQQAPILTELWKASGGTSHGADAATIAGSTGLGAAIGAAADWGRGAAIGAGAGAVVGIGAVLLTRGRPTILEPESQLTFRLVDPVKVDTTHSQQAFLPVSQDDIDGGRGRRPVLRYSGGGYGPYGPAPCGYYAPCYAPYYYAPGYVGFYGGWGWWGPGYYYGRGFYGPRGFRRY